MVDKPKVKLVGEDGNVFNVIGRCCAALKKSGKPDVARQFSNAAMRSGSYDEVLRLATEFCDVY